MKHRLTTIFAASILSAAMALEFPGPNPGKAVARLDDGRLVLQNDVIAATWKLTADRFELTEIVDRMSGGSVRARATETFIIAMADGRLLKASQLRPTGKPTVEKLQGDERSQCLSGRFAGWKVSVPLVSADGHLHVEWQVMLRDQSNYITQQVTLRAETKASEIKEVLLIHADAPKPKVLGEVDGSPVVAGSLFFACQHPMADSRVEGGRVVCSLRRYRPLEPGQSWTVWSVVGVVPAGQLRRAFLYYVERERPRPYQPFLHYNSWYDLVLTDGKINEGQCLEAIEGFGRNLTEQRGVKLAAFVFDDGWDDRKTLWRFHKGFPSGFSQVQSAAAKYGAALGVWFSPWGGYGKAKTDRLKYGKTQGFETNSRGFSLAGPKYYARFRQVCIEMMQKYGVNYFKFDGLGVGNDSQGGAGTELAPDIEVMLRLIGDLRSVRPEVFVSVTTGTWPSPYWLWYGDSIWRQGADVGYHGDGPMRQQWITYRDMIVHRMIVRRGPLYPLNSLMVVGVALGQWSIPTKMSDDLKDVVDEIRMFFGSGTQNQELYITPKKMTPEMWDALAEAAAWSQANADVLVDVHWIGGDPGKGEPYGYASWSPRKGIFVLRNPSDAPATFNLDVQTVFELPDGAPQDYRLQSPWKKPGRCPKVTLRTGRPYTFDLAPFETLLLETVPSE